MLLFFAAIALAVCCAFVLLSRRKREQYRACTNPECIRCNAYEKTISQAIHRFKSLEPSDKIDCSPCIKEAMLSLERKVQHSLASAESNPTILYIPGLPSSPLPTCLYYEQLLDCLPFTALQEEFDSIRWRGPSPHSLPWRVNQTSKGEWKILSLRNQGVEDLETLARCPVANRLLQQLAHICDTTVFGNAFYSELSPGSVIDCHTGPTNTRWRCHISLDTHLSRPAILQVGGQKT